MDIIGVNIVNEGATTAQNMAFMRGMFDTADNSGHRIMYLVCMEMMNSHWCYVCVLSSLLVLMNLFSGVWTVFKAFFLSSATLSCSSQLQSSSYIVNNARVILNLLCKVGFLWWLTKRKILHDLKTIQRVKTWQLLILFILMALSRLLF